jgi:hypothetical protein
MRLPQKEKRLARFMPLHPKAAHGKTHTLPPAMFRDLRGLVQSTFADTRIDPIRQRDDASLAMT